MRANYIIAYFIVLYYILLYHILYFIISCIIFYIIWLKHMCCTYVVSITYTMHRAKGCPKFSPATPNAPRPEPSFCDKVDDPEAKTREETMGFCMFDVHLCIAHIYIYMCVILEREIYIYIYDTVYIYIYKMHAIQVCACVNVSLSIRGLFSRCVWSWFQLLKLGETCWNQQCVLE